MEELSDPRKWAAFYFFLLLALFKNSFKSTSMLLKVITQSISTADQLSFSSCSYGLFSYRYIRMFSAASIIAFLVMVLVFSAKVQKNRHTSQHDGDTNYI